MQLALWPLDVSRETQSYLFVSPIYKNQEMRLFHITTTLDPKTDNT